MKNILLLLLLFVSFVSFAENNIKLIMDTKPVGSVIRISKYLGDLEIPLDSLRYRGETEITFDYDKRYTNGVYVIDVSTLESFQFVLINQESITAHIYESGSGMAFKPDGSDENDAFNIMMNLSDVYSQSMDTLTFAMNRLSPFIPRHSAVSDSLNNVYHRVADAYNNSLDLLNKLFPNSYTSQVLVKLDKIPLRTQKLAWDEKFDNDAAFSHIHYFENIDFSDERIITSPFLSNKILEYLYSYTERSEIGIQNAVNLLLDKPATAPQVQAFLIDLLVDFFAEKEAFEYVDYVSRKYLGNCDLSLSEETIDKISKSVKFQPGDEAPSLKLPNETGHSVPTSALTGRINVVVFWASWCPHCIREIPKLKALYDQMKGDLGVYSISVDTSKVDWLNTVEEYELDWFNVNDLKGWEGPSLEKFGVTSTPSLFLLDENLRWIGRANSFDGLYELVKEQLAE
jgi:thiol-disulfide isomerase/thioredoxin